MTDVNHRRTNKKPVNQRHSESGYKNGYSHPGNKNGVNFNQAEIDKVKAEYVAQGKDISNITFQPATSGAQRIGRTDYLDKSLHGWGRKSTLADTVVGASIGNDFSNGHRGMAKAVKGAKKFVRTRIRFKENEATRKLAENINIELD
jgi:hypothetical protein